MRTSRTRKSEARGVWLVEWSRPGDRWSVKMGEFPQESKRSADGVTEWLNDREPNDWRYRARRYVPVEAKNPRPAGRRKR